MNNPHARLKRALITTLLTASTTLLLASPVYAASDVGAVIDNVRNWLTGLLAALATLFLCVGGIRYLTASGNQRSLEQGKEGIKSAVIGYALAGLAPVLVDILKRLGGA